MTNKYCNTCKQYLPKTMFSIDIQTKDRLCLKCKQCQNRYRRNQDINKDKLLHSFYENNYYESEEAEEAEQIEESEYEKM